MKLRSVSTALAVLSLMWCAYGASLQAQMIVPTGDHDDVPKLYTQWELDLELPGRESVVGETIIDDQIFITTANHQVYAIDSANGFVNWIYHLPQTVFHYRPPVKVITVDNDGPIVFVMRTVADVVDRSTGNLIKRVKLPLSAGGSVVADVCRMYVGGADGLLIALNWNSACGSEASEAWRVRLDGPVTSAPVLGIDGILYTATASGRVYAADAQTKRFEWRFDEAETVVGQLVLHASGVDVASADRKLFVIDPGTGDLLAVHRFTDFLTEGPSVLGDVRYQYCRDEGVSAFSAGDDRRAWTAKSVRSILSRDGDRLLARGVDGSVMLLDAATGETLDSVPLSPDLRVISGSTADAVFVLTLQGKLTRASMHRPGFKRGVNLLASGMSSDDGLTGTSSNSSPVGGPNQLNDPFRSRIVRRR